MPAPSACIGEVYDTYVKCLRVADSLGMGDLTASIVWEEEDIGYNQGSPELRCC